MVLTLLNDGGITNQENKQFSLWQGLGKIHQQAIIEATNNDPLIQTQTNDQKRFKSLEQFDQWLEQRTRRFYLLTPQNEPDQTAGFAWFSQEKLPVEATQAWANDSQWTFGIRLYQAARGQRLSIPFMTAVFQDFWQNQPHEPVWLSPKKSNEVAQKIYTQFGFEFVGEKDDKLFYAIQPNKV